MQLPGQSYSRDGSRARDRRSMGVSFCKREPTAVMVVRGRTKSKRSIVAAQCGGITTVTDITRESEIQELVSTAYDKFGRTDLFCSNASIMQEGGLEVSDAQWQRAWEINFLSHVYAARPVIPRMVKQGSGYLLQTASAAGLTQNRHRTLLGYEARRPVTLPNGSRSPITGKAVRLMPLFSQGVHLAR